MRRGPQFTLDEARLVVRSAHAMGRRVLAHCSGTDGLRIAAEAGIDSIEHGYFMTPDVLAMLADKGIAWVPTLSPVHFQWEQRDICGHDATTVAGLARILESHRESIARAADLGVAVLAGSDAGSQGVRHGEALIDEILLLLDSGLSTEAALKSATSLPRRLSKAASADLAPGNRADFIALAGSPFADPQNLRRLDAVVRGESLFR